MFDTWIKRWNIPEDAVNELFSMCQPSVTVERTGESEYSIQQKIRLASSVSGATLWRNNCGAAIDQTGRHIRYGLGNDSKRINEIFKTSDLIGITSVKMKPSDIGKTYGIFTAIEVKRGNWVWKNTKSEIAQNRFLLLVKQMGGFATFAKSVDDYESALK